MANIALWLMALATPLVKRVLVALGIGLVSYAGYTALANQVRDAVLAQWGTLPANFIAIASLAGCGQALGIILSAMIARAGIIAIQKYEKLL